MYFKVKTYRSLYGHIINWCQTELSWREAWDKMGVENGAYKSINFGTCIPSRVYQNSNCWLCGSCFCGLPPANDSSNLRWTRTCCQAKKQQLAISNDCDVILWILKDSECRRYKNNMSFSRHSSFITRQNRQLGFKCRVGDKSASYASLALSIKAFRTWDPRRTTCDTDHGGVFNFGFSKNGHVFPLNLYRNFLSCIKFRSIAVSTVSLTEIFSILVLFL